MSCCNEHHKTLTDGVGKCSKPMWSGYGMPAGFCDEPAYGKSTREGLQRVGKADMYVPFLACPAHGGPLQRVCNAAATPEAGR